MQIKYIKWRSSRDKFSSLQKIYDPPICTNYGPDIFFQLTIVIKVLFKDFVNFNLTIFINCF